MRRALRELGMVVSLGLATAAGAAPIPQAGDFASFTQVGWGDPDSAGGQLLRAQYDFVYG